MTTFSPDGQNKYKIIVIIAVCTTHDKRKLQIDN